MSMENLRASRVMLPTQQETGTTAATTKTDRSSFAGSAVPFCAGPQPARVGLKGCTYLESGLRRLKVDSVRIKSLDRIALAVTNSWWRVCRRTIDLDC